MKISKSQNKILVYELVLQGLYVFIANQMVSVYWSCICFFGQGREMRDEKNCICCMYRLILLVLMGACHYSVCLIFTDIVMFLFWFLLLDCKKGFGCSCSCRTTWYYDRWNWSGGPWCYYCCWYIMAFNHFYSHAEDYVFKNLIHFSWALLLEFDLLF